MADPMREILIDLSNRVEDLRMEVDGARIGQTLPEPVHADIIEAAKLMSSASLKLGDAATFMLMIGKP